MILFLFTSIKALLASSTSIGNLLKASAAVISPTPLPSFKLPMCWICSQICLTFLIPKEEELPFKKWPKLDKDGKSEEPLN